MDPVISWECTLSWSCVGHNWIEIPDILTLSARIHPKLGSPIERGLVGEGSTKERLIDNALHV